MQRKLKTSVVFIAITKVKGCAKYSELRPIDTLSIRYNIGGDVYE